MLSFNTLNPAFMPKQAAFGANTTQSQISPMPLNLPLVSGQTNSSPTSPVSSMPDLQLLMQLMLDLLNLLISYGNSNPNAQKPTAPANNATPGQPAYNAPDKPPVKKPDVPGKDSRPQQYTGGRNGKYWGDPHLVGFDGEKYDVMGVPGKTYNMLSDKDIQYNTTFDSWGNKGNTIISKAGMQVGGSRVYFDRSGAAPTVNGKPLRPGDKIPLDKGGLASWDGKMLRVNTAEYMIELIRKENPTGDYLDSNVQIRKDGNPFGDGVKPHGLLGQTADGISGKKNTGKNQGKQGGTVIDGTVHDYETAGLWNSNFTFNRFQQAAG